MNKLVIFTTFAIPISLNFPVIPADVFKVVYATLAANLL